MHLPQNSLSFILATIVFTLTLSSGVFYESYQPLIPLFTSTAEHNTLSAESPERHERTFDIRQLHVNELHFSPEFLFGFAIAEQQNSGETHLPNSNWCDTGNEQRFPMEHLI